MNSSAAFRILAGAQAGLRRLLEVAALLIDLERAFGVARLLVEPARVERALLVG